MAEKIFNVYLFADGANDCIHGLGVVAYEESGTDAQKLAVLQSRAHVDYAKAARFPVPDNYQVQFAGESAPRKGLLLVDRYRKLIPTGGHRYVFEPMFAAIGAPRDPLVCATFVVDGRPRIEGVRPFPKPGSGS